MRGEGFKGVATEAWAFVAIAAIAFIAGLLVGNAGDSSMMEGHRVGAMESHGSGMMEGESGAQPGGGSAGGGEGLFTSSGCASCHALQAVGSSAEIGPNLDESLAPDDTTGAIEEMIVDPNAEIIEGYAANVMPQDYGQTLSPEEVHELAEFLVASTPAKPGP